MRQRINLFAPDGAVVETAEEAIDSSNLSAETGELAKALLGL